MRSTLYDIYCLKSVQVSVHNNDRELKHPACLSHGGEAEVNCFPL